MRTSDVFVIAVWAATIFGLLEGIILNITRAFPVLLAPYKASAHLLWVAPLVDLPLFLLAATGLFILMKLVRSWIKGRELIITYGFFVFIGFFTLIETPKLIHLASTVLLALGLMVICCRQLRGRERQLTDLLRRRLLWAPLLLLVAGLGVYGYEQIRELWRFEQLPAVSYGPIDAP